MRPCFKKMIFSMFVCVPMWACAMEALDPLELKLQAVVNYLTRNQTQASLQEQHEPSLQPSLQISNGTVLSNISYLEKLLLVLGKLRRERQAWF